MSNRPAVKTIADLGETDWIAVPAVGVSVQARIRQGESVKLWGDKDFANLDRISVALPHPEAAAAIVKGGTEVTGHIGNPPIREQELAGNPNAHVVLNSYDVQGGHASSSVFYATERLYTDSPKTYAALFNALDTAAKFITADPEKSADIYI